MKKRIVSLLLALALLVLPVVSAGAAQPAAADPTPVQTQTDAAAESDQHCYSYIALGDSIVAGIGLPGAVYQRNGTVLRCFRQLPGLLQGLLCGPGSR